MAKDKEGGGLGFKDIPDCNTALLAKQLWRLLTQPNLLMSKVMKGKYYPARGILNSNAKTKYSWMWKSWIGPKQILQKGLCYQIGNGKSVRIWEALLLSDLLIVILYGFLS